jgi:3-oxoacyl-[acyl-carrier protein] reductase
MDLGLKDAKVLVTAASRGLGAATARRFALEGAHVAICGRDEQRINKTAADIKAESGLDVHTFVADVAQPADVQRLVDEAAAALGGLDVLVTNAGGPPLGKFETIVSAQWDLAVQLTLLSAVNLIHAALPYLKQSKRAAILTITSASVRQPITDLILSNSIRLAVIGLTKSLANEYGPAGIRVNSILPGTIHTDRIEAMVAGRMARDNTTKEQEFARLPTNIPLGRIGDPAEFANAAVFLCSPAASFINGVMLPVDGGTVQFPL